MSIDDRTAIELISDKLGIQIEKIDSASLFVDDLGADSLDEVELIMAFEDAYDLIIEDKEVEHIKTVGDALSFLKDKGVDEKFLSTKPIFCVSKQEQPKKNNRIVFICDLCDDPDGHCVLTIPDDGSIPVLCPLGVPNDNKARWKKII